MNQQTSASAAGGPNPTTQMRYCGMLLPAVTGDVTRLEHLYESGLIGAGDEACILAAANGQLEIVKFLHRSGCRLEVVARRALTLAAANGRVEVIRYLHEQGCDIRFGNDKSIRSAAEKSHVDTLKYVHDCGADIRACESVADGLLLSPRSRATVEYLVEHGVCSDGLRVMDLVDAIRARNLVAVEAGLRGIDIPARSPIVMRAAAEQEDLEVVRLLRRCGCDIHADQNLALRIAAERGYLHLVRYLDQNGADIPSFGGEALRLAAENGNFDVVHYLHTRGCDVIRLGEETLRLIALNGHARVLDYIIAAGANAIATDRSLVDRAGRRSVAPLRSSEAPAGAGDQPGEFPTVSVLLASYNHAQYLPTSLAGIFGQTCPATEVIIVDDGSTDDTVQVVEGYMAHLPHVRLLMNGKNRGQHHSIQRALLAAQGEYVVWASADDLLLPEFLERSLLVLRAHPEAGLCFSRLAVFVDGTTSTTIFTEKNHAAAFDYGAEPRALSPEELSAILRRHYLWMSGNTVLAKREALLEIGGFEHALRWHADWFAYYVVALRYGACMIPETLAMMRERSGTYSAGGMNDPKQQKKVLVSLLDMIKSPRYRDLLSVFRRCAALFSPFGRSMVYAALATPRHYDFAWSLARLAGRRILRRKYLEARSALGRRLRRLKSKSPGA